MFNPVSTYRIQLNKDFTLKDLEKLLPYFQKLGVRTIYASSIFSAVPGSTHGYDVTDPNSINPEIGNIEQLKKLSKKMKLLGLSWLQDVVPNHMALHSNNPWLMDVLRQGKHSPYYEYFDFIDTAEEKIMVPVLGKSLSQEIQDRNIQLAFAGNEAVVKYYEATFPLRTDLPGKLTAEIISSLNSSPKELEDLLDNQYYTLCEWNETSRKINYRRFFTINGLISLNIHNKSAFSAYHILIGNLIKEKVFQGVRIDHIDGLKDPTDFLKNMRDLLGEDRYLVVEKILHRGETLPEEWPIQGSTGYDFLATLNNLFTRKENENKFREFYSEFTGKNNDIKKDLLDKKRFILKNYMRGDLENLTDLFYDTVAQSANVNPDRELFRSTLSELLVFFPRYRAYPATLPLNDAEKKEYADILHNIESSSPNLSAGVNLLREIIFAIPDKGDEEINASILNFIRRCMQFTGPLMAKGFEDTLMYDYNCFIAHNEVGDSPQSFGITVSEYHEAMEKRQEKEPLAMNVTATHDTKRGEDARARLNALSEIPDEWFARVREWHELNAPFRKNNIPDKNEEYFIYQTIVGHYPFSKTEQKSFGSRLEEYILKALKEAKSHTKWEEPNEDYENKVKDFLTALFDKKNKFKSSLEDFLTRVGDNGIINSLSQVILRNTSPGIPDTFQGTELFDFSFVDPDNRRPVNYALREKSLSSFVAGTDQADLIRQWENRQDGIIKLRVLQKLLKTRSGNAEFFNRAAYVPLKVEGAFKDNVIAFARKLKSKYFITAVPLGTTAIPVSQDGVFDWHDTRLILPAKTPWKNILDDAEIGARQEIELNELFSTLPVAVLESIDTEPRTAGILLHISSLPSRFPIGDLGPAARNFADFLARSNQRVWQVLPVNPVSAGSDFSPYSALSSMAGNTMLISPEDLADIGLIAAEELEQFYSTPFQMADLHKASEIKDKIFDICWKTFLEKGGAELKNEFENYCSSESWWLDDYALYTVLRNINYTKAWFQWDDKYKSRDSKALEEFSNEHSDELNKVKFFQFIFYRQWTSLRQYCNNAGIRIFGDLPFYISYDSADVWKDQQVFRLDEQGQMTGLAGVPPDYFSATGQLWGMPTYRWDVMKKENYRWWIERLRKNFQLFDLLRIDHFRAFAKYWEVAAGEQTAINGKWKTGPGEKFFDEVEKQLGKLSLVAEDLGYEMEGVYVLRDALGLPGMKVLTFAFGKRGGSFVDRPHNHTPNSFVYTGTHDNNTLKGWFIEETGEEEKEAFRHYTGLDLNRDNVHILMSKLAYSSVGRTVILPMQDVLGLDQHSRMNTPGSTGSNWRWKMLPGEYSHEIEERLKKWTIIYDRY